MNTHDYIRLRNEYMQRARDHRGWAGNTYLGDVATARSWSRHLVRHLRWLREKSNAAERPG